MMTKLKKATMKLLEKKELKQEMTPTKDSHYKRQNVTQRHSNLKIGYREYIEERAQLKDQGNQQK